MIGILLLPLAASAQDKAVSAITIRAFLNDPSQPEAKFFVPNTPDTRVPVNLNPGELPAEQTAVVINGRLTIYNSPTVDPAQPEAAVVASVAVAKNLGHAVAIIQPLGADRNPRYGIVLIDDSASAFPPGESRIVSMTTLPVALQIGEHKLPAASGKVTAVPRVMKLDPYNMAQTDFFYQRENNWIPFNESKMKYLQSYRQIFICSTRPGSQSPTLTTLIDDAPAAAGKEAAEAP